MPSFSLIPVEGGTGSGSHTLPVYQPAEQPNLGGRRQGTAGQEDVYTWGSVTWPAPAYSSVSPSYKKITDDTIQGGWYWMGSENSGYQIYVEADETALQFGPIKIRGTTFGSGSSVGGSGTDVNRCYGIGCKSNQYGDVYYMWYGSTDTMGEGGVKTYGINYAFTSTNISDVVTGDNPYNPPSGQAGSDSSAGGSSSGGAGYPTGTNAGIPESKKSRANVGCDIYQCNAVAIRAFTKMLWGSSDSGFISAFFERVRNTVYNPINSIITCHSLPSAFAVSGGTATGIKAGGVNFSTYDSACVGAPVSTEWSASPLYTFKPFEECWGNYADYAKMSVALYLPFCGVVPLDPSSVLGKNRSGGGGIAVQYWCNILNGNCAAFVCGWDREGDYKVLKIATGNCAQPCPISGNDRGMAQKLGALVGFAQGMTSIGSQVASQGGGAILTGNFGGLPTTPSILGKYASNGITAASQFLTAAQHTSVVGSLNGAAGFAASTQIILLLDYGIPVESPNYTSIRARPSEVSGTVSSFSGYCELEVHADGIGTATDEEKREIERICISGIII